MHADRLKCSRCTWEGKLDLRYECPICGRPLDVSYDYGRVNKEQLDRALSHYTGVWSFAELLPVKEQANIISLNEGGTPLYFSRKKIGCSLYWKDETRNPTLSFKDRPNTVGISVAKELGFEDVSIASTGNGGASLSAYAAKSGMKCHICIPKSTPQGKVLQAEYHGAEIVLCEGDYSESYRINKMKSAEHGWANMTSTYLNPYTMEGDKTIAYELFAKLDRQVSQWVAVPLGAGAMLTGIYKGFCELRQLGFCEKIPRMIGVQSEGCAPIVDAWLGKHSEVKSWECCNTVAGAIADPLKGYTVDGTRTLQTIYQSNGIAVKVSDQKIMRWVSQMAVSEGLFVEPASAAGACAIESLVEKGIIQESDIAVSIVTAHGLKDSEALEKFILNFTDKNEGVCVDEACR